MISIEVERKKNKPLAFAFHGFLGEPKDYDFLNTNYELIALDLKPQFVSMPQRLETWDEMCLRVFEEIKSVLLDYTGHSLKIKDITIISYSMGSKIFISIIDSLKSLLNELEVSSGLQVNLNWIALSTHFGCYKDEAEILREEWDRRLLNEKFIKIIDNQNLNYFLKEWNDLGLFKEDPIFSDKISVEKVKNNTIWSIEQIKHYFNSWSQNQYKKISELVSEKPFKSIWIFYGEQDLKYKTQATRFYMLLQNQILVTEEQTTSLKNECSVYLSKNKSITFGIVGFKHQNHRLLIQENFESVYELINQGLDCEF